MRAKLTAGLAGFVIVGVAPSAALGSVTYLTQDRFIRVQTTANDGDQRIDAPGFLPFVETLTLATTFVGAGGVVLPNSATAGIDCQVDPDAVRATGSLTGAGGLSITGMPVFGEAKADVRITFRVDVPTPFTLAASPRPNFRPDDGFQVELENLDTSIAVFAIDETDPPQQVNIGGTLPPGNYSLKYEVQVAVSAARTSADFAFNFSVRPPCHGACAADLDDGSGAGRPDGGVTVDDLLYYLSLYEAGAGCADLDDGSGTGVRDGGVTIDDLLYFLARYQAGC